MAAWPSYPCRNPNCKSHGSPHPNCKCGPPAPQAGENAYMMAEGGEIPHFCSQNQAHLPSCEHHFSGADPEHAVPSAIAHMGILGLSNKGKGSLFDNIGSKGLGSGIANFSSQVDRGDKKIKNHIEALFGGPKAEEEPDADDRDKVNDLISKGHLNQQIQSPESTPEETQNFAKGGEAETPEQSLAELLPVHNILLNAAKGRAHNYLNSLRPQKDAPKLAFDDHIKDPEAERKYDRAIDVANKPLSILGHARKGTLMPEHIQHLNSLYPELKQHLDKNLTERITKAQLSEEKPSYHVRQSLSMLMGAPLSGELTQPAIMAAQMTFQSKQPQQPAAPGKTKKGTAPLSKASDDSWTASQAAEKRQIAER